MFWAGGTPEGIRIGIGFIHMFSMSLRTTSIATIGELLKAFALDGDHVVGA